MAYKIVMMHEHRLKDLTALAKRVVSITKSYKITSHGSKQCLAKLAQMNHSSKKITANIRSKIAT